jgi:hypothetical protein
MNRELISKAVESRLTEVCARVSRINADYGDSSGMVSLMKQVLSSSQPAASKFPGLAPSDCWIDAGTIDCLTSLKVLSAGSLDVMQLSTHPPVQPFLAELKEVASARRSLFPPLTRRYACPLNFSFQAEEDVREFVLMRLMVADRALIERSIDAVDADDLLLKLSLIAVHASMTTDLRFLDALNYYYELLPANWYPNTENGWLWPIFLGLYARALISWS